MEKSLGIYLSIPFCKSKCSFCNFASGVFGMDRLQSYADCLCAELRKASTVANSLRAELPRQVDTVYFGGGTPSLLAPQHLRQIFATLRDEFDLSVDAEITLEAAPGQVAGPLLEEALRLGINRVSFGVQSFLDAEAAAVGRLHTGPECHREIRRMLHEGVPRVSLDLIAGLPYQTAYSFEDSIDQAIDSGVDHLSLYLLEVDEASRLGREAMAGGARYHASALPSEDATSDWYLAACETLARASFAQYEISNFAQPGCTSRHNLKYWQRQPYLGVGLDAHSMLLSPDYGEQTAVRWANGDDLDEYLGATGSKSPLPLLGRGRDEARKVDRISIEGAFEEALFLGLRLNRGVNLKQIASEFGQSRLDAALDAASDIEAAGLLNRDELRLRLTPAGRLASNEVFSRLLAA